jgi:DNA repair exonuclease SbcCD ATPase subunit
MTTLNEKQSARIASLEKQLAVAQKNAEAAAAAGPSTAKSAEPVASTSDLSKSEQKELKALRDEVAVLRKGVKEKDQKSKLRCTLSQLIISRSARERVSGRSGTITYTPSFYSWCTQSGSFYFPPTAY